MPADLPPELRANPGALRRGARRLLPFGLRTALRRLPAALAHAVAPDPTKTADRAPFAHVQCRRETPLVREATPYAAALQAGKETNVRRAAALVDGALVGPGASFSWHRHVGPPSAARGFAPGPEIHEGRLVAGLGGGACQVSNLVYWLALHAGMEIVERHRHDLDLFPDHDRTAPFGCGATVYFPTRDLRFRNPGPEPLLLELCVEDGALRGAARFQHDPGVRFEVIERDHRFFREGDAVVRANRLVRRRLGPYGEVAEEPVAENRARVLYDVPGV
ncbi:MAG TPA: VanW family protein [Anaeromyxobacter sp.]